jgi:hypothetical protein
MSVPPVAKRARKPSQKVRGNGADEAKAVKAAKPTASEDEEEPGEPFPLGWDCWLKMYSSTAGGKACTQAVTEDA